LVYRTGAYMSGSGWMVYKTLPVSVKLKGAGKLPPHLKKGNMCGQ